MNLACCFIHAGYEHDSERDSERGGEKDRKRKTGRKRERESVKWKAGREEKKQMEMSGVTGKEKYEERECDKNHCWLIYTLCYT